MIRNDPTMKLSTYFLFLFTCLLVVQVTVAQDIDEWNVIDIDGTIHDMQALQDDNIPILVYAFNSFSYDSWLVHETGIPIDIYNEFGQGGSEEVAVFYLVHDDFSSVSDIMSIDYSLDLGPGYTDLDLTENNPIPIILAIDNPDIDPSPKALNIWACPQGGYTWLFNFPTSVESVMNELFEDCCTPLNPSDIAISWTPATLFETTCDPSTLEYEIENNEASYLNGFSINVYRNNAFLESVTNSEIVPGCSSLPFEYSNSQISEGDEIMMAISQPNAFTFNDTITIFREEVDTTTSKIKFEILNALDSFTHLFFNTSSGSGVVNSTTNWYNYLFLEPGCHKLWFSSGEEPDDQSIYMIGSVDENDIYLDTLFFGSFDSNSIQEQLTIFVEGPAANQEIWGYVFEDINEQGFFSPDLPRIEGIQVNYGTSVTYTDSDGYYEFFEVLPSANIVSVSYDETAWPVYTTPNSGNIGGGFVQNFGLSSNDPIWELTDLYNSGLPYICENIISNTITVFNTGNQPTSGELTFTHDPLLTPISFNPSPSSITGNEITFSIEEISYGGARNYSIFYQELSADFLGQIMSGSYALTTFDSDGVPVNIAEYISNDTLFCAFDPNDKYGFPLGVGDQGFIDEETVLKYRIRFQNTGNLPATTVVIRDTLPQELNWDSFQPLSSSHNYTVQANSETREVVWTFNNIMLPDSASDPLGSIGNFWYQIEMNDLEPGDQIQNKAYIYFDLNEAIITNTSLHTISDVLSVSLFIAENLVMYPNPASNNVSFKSLKNGDSGFEIFDTTGRLLLSGFTEYGTIDIGLLSSGLYFVYLDEYPGSIGKLLVER